MLAVLKKEINLFFSSLIGYITIIVFLLATGLFIWVFPDTSILDYGYATLDSLFYMAPWIFMFLIPAITMRSFSEEVNTGTIELLSTKPITDWQIILGKYLAAVALVSFALIPTLLYFYSVYQLGNPVGNLDIGATWGSYIGLLLIGSAFTAIGIFGSALTNNAIVAFMLAVFLCFILYIGFDYLSRLDIFFAKMDAFVEQLGMESHYESISRGVVDSRDVIYFLSIAALFLIFTKTSLDSRKW